MSQGIWTGAKRLAKRWSKRASLAAIIVVTPAIAHAQPAPPQPEPAPAPSPESAKPEAADAKAGEKAEAKGEAAPDVAALAEEVKEQRKTIEELQDKVDAAAGAESDNDWTNKFKIYGFTDVGLNRVWVNEHSQLGNFFNSANATSFVVGNLNVYFDAQPVKGWRSLVEVRFTNAPQGEVANLGGLAGKFERTNTMQTDPHAGSVAASMWGGYTVIERAHIDWTDHQLFKVRVGNFFTPFGIWNVDHGTPTLIAVQLPGMIQLRTMPIRQTGIQVYGNTFAGDWELGYMATVSNGRQELSNFAFDDNRGFGGRIYANNDKGDVAMRFGGSFYTGRVRDKEVDIVGVNPVVFSDKKTFDYREYVGGLDASLDIGGTRIRAEGAMRSVRYEPGLHEANDGLNGASVKPDRITSTGYVLVAQQLPVVPVEVFANVDATYGHDYNFGDTILTPSGGFNIRFTKAVQLKTQLSRTYFVDSRGQQDASEIAKNNATYLFSRLVLVF